MLFVSALLALAASSAVVAQNATANSTLPGVASVPACAIACTVSSLPGSGCAAYGVANITCLCTDPVFQGVFVGCQMKTCAPADVTAALQFGLQSCAAAGYPINVSGLTGNTTSVAAAPAAATSAAAAATAASSTAPAAAAATTAAKSAAGLNGVGMAAVVGIVGAGLALVL